MQCRPFVHEKISDEMLATARTGCRLFRILLEAVPLERVDLITDEARNSRHFPCLVHSAGRAQPTAAVTMIVRAVVEVFTGLPGKSRTYPLKMTVRSPLISSYQFHYFSQFHPTPGPRGLPLR